MASGKGKARWVNDNRSRGMKRRSSHNTRDLEECSLEDEVQREILENEEDDVLDTLDMRPAKLLRRSLSSSSHQLTLVGHPADEGEEGGDGTPVPMILDTLPPGAVVAKPTTANSKPWAIQKCPEHFDLAPISTTSVYNAIELADLVKLAELAWTPPPDHSTPDKLVVWQMKRFGLELPDGLDRVSLETLRDSLWKNHYERLVNLKKLCLSRGLISQHHSLNQRLTQANPSQTNLFQRLHQLISLAYRHYRTLANMLLTRSLQPDRPTDRDRQFDETARHPLEHMPLLGRVDALCDDNFGWNLGQTDPITLLFHYLLHRLSEMSARRYRDNIWVPYTTTVTDCQGKIMMVETGAYRFWNEPKAIKEKRRVGWSNIDDFVEMELNSNRDAKWYNLAQQSMISRAHLKGRLKDCVESQFPVIREFDKHVLAFRNLVYSTFYEGEVRYWVYGENRIPRDLVAINFIDEEMNLELLPTSLQAQDFLSSETHAFYRQRQERLQDFEVNPCSSAWNRVIRHLPTYCKLLKDQFFDEPDCELIMQNLTAIMGRSWFWLNEVDHYELLFFVHGPGGSGKSSFLELVHNAYSCDAPRDFAGTIECDNQNQKDFALSPLFDKAIVIITENNEKMMAISQRTLVKAVTGEAISCPVKHQNDPVCGKWRVPLILGGNAMMHFSEQGQFYRRIFCAQFRYVIAEPDGELKKKLAQEFPLIFHLSTMCLLDLIKKTGPKSLWSDTVRKSGVVSPYFFRIRESVRDEMHPLFGILHDTKQVVFGPQRYCLKSELETRIVQRCRKLNQEKPCLNDMFFSTAYAKHTLSDELLSLPWRGEFVKSTFVMGFSWADENTPPDENFIASATAQTPNSENQPSSTPNMSLNGRQSSGSSDPSTFPGIEQELNIESVQGEECQEQYELINEPDPPLTQLSNINPPKTASSSFPNRSISKPPPGILSESKKKSPPTRTAPSPSTATPTRPPNTRRNRH